MGIVSGAVLENGGSVTGIVPYAIHNGGGEREKSAATPDTVGSRPVAGHERVSFFFMSFLHRNNNFTACRWKPYVMKPKYRTAMYNNASSPRLW